MRTPLYLGALAYKWCTAISSAQAVLSMLTLPWLLTKEGAHRKWTTGTTSF